MTIEQKITIHCSPEKLWQTLTQAEFTKQYMYNCEVSSDWKVGSPVTWEGNYQGYEAFQKGEVLEFEPFKKIKYTTLDPNVGMEDVAENYIHVTYEITPNADSLDLLIINETFDGNSERMGHIKAGWDMVVPKIKEVAEK